MRMDGREWVCLAAAEAMVAELRGRILGIMGRFFFDLAVRPARSAQAKNPLQLICPREGECRRALRWWTAKSWARIAKPVPPRLFPKIRYFLCYE
jgi:hypothetical protein